MSQMIRACSRNPMKAPFGIFGIAISNDGFDRFSGSFESISG
jgi:hypothetical protein